MYLKVSRSTSCRWRFSFIVLSNYQNRSAAVSVIHYYNKTIKLRQHFHKLKGLVQKGVSSKL
jgi:hypothetical protein